MSLSSATDVDAEAQQDTIQLTLSGSEARRLRVVLPWLVRVRWPTARSRSRNGRSGVARRAKRSKRC